MQPLDPLDVPFCDLCNASVPLQDLERGMAMRHMGKTIGACCLDSLRSGGANGQPADRTAAAGVPATTSASPASGAARPASPEGRILPLGIAILSAIAAATLFLDYRLAGADQRLAEASNSVARSVKTQGDVLQDVSLRLDGVSRRADVDAILGRLEGLEKAGTKSAEQLAGIERDQAKDRESITAIAEAIKESDRRRTDYGPMLAELRTVLQQQSVTLAEILARPRPVEVPVSAAPPKADVPAGMPQGVAEQVARLKDDDSATRFDAVDKLLRMRDPAVLEHLMPMLKDPDVFVRRVVAEGLRDYRKPAVVDALLDALDDEAEWVRDSALRSLKDLTGQKLPFEVNGTRDARARAVQKWREWWDKNRDSFGT